MALVNSVGAKVSAKVLAEELYAQAINKVVGSFDEHELLNKATEREMALVQDQLEKIGTRLLKVLHFDVVGMSTAGTHENQGTTEDEEDEEENDA